MTAAKKIKHFGIILGFFFTLWVTPALSYVANDPKDSRASLPALQATLTPTLTSSLPPTSVFTFTVEELGFNNDVSLNSPLSKIEYSFRIPAHIQLQDSSFIEFDLSYHYSDLANSTQPPSTLGNVIITLNEQIIETFPLQASNFDHYPLRIPLPPTLLKSTRGSWHNLAVTLDMTSWCAVPHQAELIIHPDSYISLNYAELPLTPELAAYPAPFFQRSFKPDEIILAVPARPSPAEAAGALSMAAKLGHLTNNQLAVNAAVDLDLIAHLTSSSSTLGQHLLVTGRPDHNRLLPLLNQIAKLPAPLRERQMSLVTHGPAAVSPGQVFTYTFAVTNTTNLAATLSLVEPLPSFTEFVACEPHCLEDRDSHSLTWANESFSPAEAKSFSLVLQAMEVITAPYLENTVTLTEVEAGVINGDTLISSVRLAEEGDKEQQTSTANASPYLFIHEGRAIAEHQGIIQEIVSPWDTRRAILIVTGLDDAAIRKASQALSSEAHLSNLSGLVALVSDSLPLEADLLNPLPLELTFQELGYADKVIQGPLSQKINYSFFIPPDRPLANNLSLDLIFSHTSLTETVASITVFFNDLTVATLALDEQTAVAGRQKINLPVSLARPGASNRLAIQFIPRQERGGECEWLNALQDFSFTASSDSKISLAYDAEAAPVHQLNLFPFPFNHQPSLQNLLFALPAVPTSSEWQSALRLAAHLGNSARGKTILPAVSLGDPSFAHNLADYHIIAIGRPSRNPIIQAANAHLPQPFLPGSDEIQQVDHLIFRLPRQVNLGYLQLITSPWNQQRTLLAITGTTDESVTWAAQSLFQGNFKQPAGNLAVINNLSSPNPIK